MYCYFGHRIRALHAGVLNAAYQSRWVQGSDGSRSAAIMISTMASSPNSISQIGSPFFSLSMETFTSVSKKSRKMLEY
jgi:7tm Odorant receptor